MKTQLEIVSRMLVKPASSLTKNHPPIHSLYFFDQITPPFYCGIVYIYTTNQYIAEDHIQNDIVQKSSLLQRSLSNVLSQHYPLPGRRKDDTSVGCNDQGEDFKNVARLTSRKATEVYMCSSCCNFPVYKADFGLGKPAWTSSWRPTMHNVFLFHDTGRGDGIEVIFTLEDGVMAFLERHPLLLQFAHFFNPTSTHL